MQPKILIIIIAIVIAIIVGYKLMDSSPTNSEASVTDSTPLDTESTNAAQPAANSITSKPLGQQPKEILNSVESQLQQAQQLEQERLDETNSVQ